MTIPIPAARRILVPVAGLPVAFLVGYRILVLMAGLPVAFLVGYRIQPILLPQNIRLSAQSLPQTRHDYRS